MSLTEDETQNIWRLNLQHPTGVCDAHIWKHRDDSGHEIQAAARVTPPSRGPIGLRRYEL